MPTKHLSPELLNKRRLEAVRLRLDGHTVADTAARTGLSAPTVSAAWKAFREGGWEAVPVKGRGRKPGQANTLGEAQGARLKELLKRQPPGTAPGWSSRMLAEALADEADGPAVSARAVDHWLAGQQLKPAPLTRETLEKQRGQAGRWYRQQASQAIEAVRQAGGPVWRGGVTALPRRRYRLHLHGKRDTLYLRCLGEPPRADDYLALFQRLLDQANGRPVALLFHGAYFRAVPAIHRWLEKHPNMRLVMVPAGHSPEP
ncbi:MAG: helix-turn-helix domain-containing protein [Halomonas sp.]|uniref:helix-turn-helix domain-containing protein n=1 Tax=Halomonas sp. TaxID=1486246 RepID=UPI0028708D7A|nr:helix-turn-helix domain-containing protein [Halomonas sp.]MDR9439417.1 helix-turn-helix domain-containing protein [Halomonas sp.]